MRCLPSGLTARALQPLELNKTFINFIEKSRFTHAVKCLGVAILVMPK